MANVFEGTPDARQSDDVTMPTSRFRPKYKALSAAEKSLHDEIKAKATELENLFMKVGPGSSVPHSRYNSLAITSLEESVMWAIKDLTT